MLERVGARLAICLAMVPACAWATCAHEADGTDACVSEQIQLLYVTQSGAVYLQPTSSLAGFSCAPVSGTYLLLNPAAPNFKAAYAALLSARVVGATVTLVMDPSQSTCTISYVTL
jgi:hypothetical protein